MAVPKKKTSKSKTRSRRAAAWKVSAPSKSVCPKCSSSKLPHRVCQACGWYGSADSGRQAIEVD